MDKLDINTEKGQLSLKDERDAQEIVKKCWGVSIIETPKKSTAKCDGLLVKNETELIACFETKCRYDMTYELLQERGSWLITLEKLKKGSQISKLLQVPYYGFLYLLPESNPEEKILLYVKITNSNGEFLFDIEESVQTTRMTINGGEIDRLNGYIPVDKLTIISPVVFMGIRATNEKN